MFGEGQQVANGGRDVGADASVRLVADGVVEIGLAEIMTVLCALTGIHEARGVGSEPEALAFVVKLVRVVHSAIESTLWYSA